MINPVAMIVVGDVLHIMPQVGTVKSSLGACSVKARDEIVHMCLSSSNASLAATRSADASMCYFHNCGSYPAGCA